MQVVDEVERALISLMYAASDVSHREEETSDPEERGRLQTLLARIMVAKRELQRVLAVSGRTHRGGAPVDDDGTAK